MKVIQRAFDQTVIAYHLRTRMLDEMSEMIQDADGTVPRLRKARLFQVPQD